MRHVERSAVGTRALAGIGRTWRVVGVVSLLSLVAMGAAAQPQPPTVTFEAMVADLGNDDPEVRLRAVLALKQAAFPESAVPLTRSLADGDDRVQAEAIAAELNI